MMSKRYKTLIQERADLVAEAKTLLAGAEGRGLNDDEKLRDDEIGARLAELGGEIEREERVRQAELAMGTVSADFSDISGMHNRIEDDPMRGFASTADFARAVKAAGSQGGQIDDRLLIGAAAPSNYHTHGGSEGYMAPPQMSREIWELVFDEGNLITEVDAEPTEQNSVLKTTDESTPWGSSGVQAYWRSEGQQMTASKLATKEETMRLHELYAFVSADEELLADAPRLNDRLNRKSAQAIDWKINAAFFDGTGAGTPLGWTKSGALVTQAKETGQAAATITAENVSKMYARCINPAEAIWFVNQDAFPQLMTMTLGDQPIWTPPMTGFQNAPGGLLFGRPVRFSEHCETVGAKGDIQLINPKGYYAITRTNGPEYAESMHLYFDYNKKAFRWVFRLNGQPHLSAPVTPNKGSSNRSHFVTLAVRA